MKIKHRERGQSLVELSISLVILLYLLSGAVEFGIAFFQFVQLRDAAQEGALFGSMRPTFVDRAYVEQRVRSASSSPINLADTSVVKVTIAINNTDVWQNGSSLATPSTACEGNSLTVTVEYDHQIFMPFMSRIIGSTLPLKATVTDTILAPVCPAT